MNGWNILNRLLGNGRILVAGGVFALTGYVLHMVGANAKLLDSAPFMTIVGVVVGTGFGSAVGYYLGSSQSSAEKDATLKKLATKE